ncbi:protein GL2-INTERACTING REPRESSOR 1-like [Lotus japonicus]|uniref:protein GL2-INTERACTING REPRESSOR 1-like n=1 Tax=Lotus japonicus TaxID=34305 RepID=UPI00258259E1|nr:protein GL2-INTERACTING REPRESSOR 1-like [Lotus japonicus]
MTHHAVNRKLINPILVVAATQILSSLTSPIPTTPLSLQSDLEEIKMSNRARSPTLAATSSSAFSSGDMSSDFTTLSSSISVYSSEGSSCVSSSEAAEVTKAMLLVGCPRCFMYVMSSEIDPRCPKCKSTVLLDLLPKEENNTKKTIT